MCIRDRHTYDLFLSTWTQEWYINIHRLKWSQVDTHKAILVLSGEKLYVLQRSLENKTQSCLAL